MTRSILFFTFFVYLANIVLAEPTAKSDVEPEQRRIFDIVKPINQGEKIVLFDGTSTGLFVDKEGGEINWQTVDGSLVSAKGTPGTQYFAVRSNHIASRLHFRDAEIYVEFNMDKAANGNSGIYLHGHYEVQIVNSVGKSTPNKEDIGAIYGIHSPLVNAGKDYDEWQTCEIKFRAPRREAGKIIEKGRVSVRLNGQLVIDNAEIDEPVSQSHPYRYGATPYLQQIEKRLLETGVGPVFLQDHDSPCRFRNLWIKPLDDKAFILCYPFYDKTL